jgi:hypothetical protein
VLSKQADDLLRFPVLAASLNDGSTQCQPLTEIQPSRPLPLPDCRAHLLKQLPRTKLGKPLRCARNLFASPLRGTATRSAKIDTRRRVSGARF